MPCARGSSKARWTTDCVRARLLVLPVLLAAGCISPSPEAMEAARRGRDDALADVARGRPRTAFIGLQRDDESPLDPKTGRVRFSVGCCKSTERIAYCGAYQDVVDDAVSQGGLSGAALLRKATTRDAVAARFAAGRGVEVGVGGPGIEAPGGRFHVDVAPASGVYGISLWSTDRGDGSREELRRLGADRVVAAFDEKGETLFVRDSAAGVYATFDLLTQLPLQVFPDRVDAAR